MPRFPLRRAHLIAPFGVGSMSTFPNGTSLMVAGLDHWFKADGGTVLDLDEFRVEEWRLQRRLGVRELRLPPDHRRPRRGGDGVVPNTGIRIPAVRFPEVHVCPRCNTLTTVPATERGRQICPACERDGRKVGVTQTQFVAMCDQGHVQDLPFREWVHRDVSPLCRAPIRLFGSSGSSLVSVMVECECGARRNLSGITESIDDERTVLSHRLASSDGGGELLCRGSRPWLGRRADEGCDRPLRAGLRSATNTYFAQVITSVYVPREQQGVPPDVMARLSVPPASTWIATVRDVDGTPTTAALRRRFPGLLPETVDEASLDRYLAGVEPDEAEEAVPEDETAFRSLELAAMSRPRNDLTLTVRYRDPSEYDLTRLPALGAVGLVDRLRVTRVFAGFTRVMSVGADDLEQRRRRIRMLWSSPPAPGREWLPCAIVNGEGILLRLDEERLREWETSPDVIERTGRLDELARRAAERRGRAHEPIESRFVLLHTLAHLLIVQLAFESGYSATSLNERLYTSRGEGMGALLIYTAAGDSEGTLGGLVRLGRPGLLEATLQRAVERSRWCSSDPICSELGASGGQGPDSCNLAACHDCAIVSETSCETGNRHLDRALVSDPRFGLFREML